MKRQRREEHVRQALTKSEAPVEPLGCVTPEPCIVIHQQKTFVPEGIVPRDMAMTILVANVSPFVVDAVAQ
jgi:hypothetical protein